MISLPNITVNTQIYESANTLVYRGIRHPDNTPIILKFLKQDYPNAEELTRYKQEYEIIRSLNLDGVIQAYSEHDYQRSRVLVLEDFGGVSLQKSMLNPSAQSYSLSLPDFLLLAIKIADILGKVHAANVIHRDINPGNIVVNPDTGIVKIIDFGISTRLSITHPTFKNPNILEGTLAYMSPEQTGRMNRLLDYRTDFYSLGVTFYELLTGQLPFTTKDVLELVHCHIAKQPIPPYDIRYREKKIQAGGDTETETKDKRQEKDNSYFQIPKVISDIVMKLMAKNVEERYQSAWGIKSDLEECLRQLKTCNQIEPFLLATHDISNKFQIPQKLYGREQEVKTLLTVFERVAKREGIEKIGEAGEDEEECQSRSQFKTKKLKSRVEMMLVAGYSGIGKSALVQEIYKPITQTRGYFVAGKFEQFQHNVPYSAVVSAFQKLMWQLLSESEAQVQQWRERILAALGSNGQVIIDVIPEVKLVIGEQPPVPKVEPTEAQNRFNSVFQTFIRVFCSQEHPLTIFLDDLQWVDLSSVKLIELMMTDSETQCLLLIGTYRDNEVSPTDPLVMMVQKLRKQGVAINQITLTPLDLKAITQLIADTLRTAATTVTPLAKLVLHKTGGNPFFVNELLKTLYKENLITFNFKHLNWQWDVTQIEKNGVTNNVLKLMINKLKQLPESVQQVLRLAACIGADFDLNTLSIICERQSSAIFSDLIIAIQAGLILPISELDTDLLIQNYQFVHDRIQQAAYDLIEVSQKQVVHLQIGRLLLHDILSNDLPKQLFAIVDHLNLGVELVSDKTKQIEIAHLNLQAAQKAKSAAAFSAAFAYLVVGIKLVGGDWRCHYDLNLKLHEEATEVAYLCHDFEQMEQLATVVLQNARTILDKVKVYEVKIQACMVHAQRGLAFQMALQPLSLLGIHFSEQPDQADIREALSKTAANLSGRKIERLIDLPIMSEPHILAAMRLLASATTSTYIAVPEFFPLIVSKQVNLSIEYGHSAQSPIAYAAYGVLLCGLNFDFESGYQYGQLAINLIERFDNRQSEAKIIFTVNAYINPWKKHIKDSLNPLLDAYQIGVKNGDPEFAVYAALTYCEYCYFIGQSLQKLKQKFSDFIKAFEQLQQTANVTCLNIYWQAILNLSSIDFHPTSLLDPICNESSNLHLLHQANDRYILFNLYTNELILAYLFQDIERALKNGELAETYLNGVTGHYAVSIMYFYYSLALLARYSIATELEQVDILHLVTTIQEKMQLWAYYAPMNYQHKYDLFKAEKARVLSQTIEAMNCYELAIQGAKNNGYIQEEALAYELAGRFYLACNMERIAQTYLNEAHYCYKRWGADAKVSDLDARYSSLLSPVLTTCTIDTSVTSLTNRSSNRSEYFLDLAALIKASQAISSEIVLDKLLSSLIKVLLEDAGAQKGFLLLKVEGQLQIEASGEVNSKSVTVLQSLPINQHLPESIINYVFRTYDSVVLNHAVQNGDFVNDPYIQRYQSKSILCVPVIHKGKLSGIVYLENNLATNAFTSDHIETVKVLSTQAAISIENARLYSEITKREQALRESERKLTQILECLPIGVAILESDAQLSYINPVGAKILKKGVNSFVSVEQMPEIYQFYLAGIDQIYPWNQMPLARALQGEKTSIDNLEIHCLDRIVPVETWGTPVYDEQGNIIFAITTFQDITERKKAEELVADYNRDLEIQVAERTLALVQREDVLRQQKELLQTIIDNIPVMIVLYDSNCHIQLVNREFEQCLGWTRTELEGIDVLAECYPVPQYLQQVIEQMAAATGKWQDFKTRLCDGRYVDTAWANIPLSDGMSLSIGQDIRDRKQAEAASVLAERNRMAQEIHDTLAQAFTGITVHLDAAFRRLKTDPEAVQDYIKIGRDLARYGLDEARRSVEALRPQYLEEGDLYSALSRLATQIFSYSDVHTVCEVIGEPFPLSIEVENNLLRIGQEAMTNAFKYAKASEIRITLVYETEHFYLRIKDDGQGFEKSSISIGSGFGLLGMTERVERIGAELTIQTAPMQGTEVVVSVAV
ncbi:MAG: AAA family ATPase [Chroococcidiopsidaceae cyanobacterium CP_BM_ER_R8_30]|nr:AAA family ATPase [Chroococcidiopsidaceae cyanobacterium CP_BM_ER_R8_30]